MFVSRVQLKSICGIHMTRMLYVALGGSDVGNGYAGSWSLPLTSTYVNTMLAQLLTWIIFLCI